MIYVLFTTLIKKFAAIIRNFIHCFILECRVVEKPFIKLNYEVFIYYTITYSFFL